MEVSLSKWEIHKRFHLPLSGVSVSHLSGNLVAFRRAVDEEFLAQHAKALKVMIDRISFPPAQ